MVDPEWLASNDKEARALRQTQAGAVTATWQVLHRVTYVEHRASYPTRIWQEQLQT